jgi:ComEC/Rec2-related protein
MRRRLFFIVVSLSLFGLLLAIRWVFLPTKLPAAYASQMYQHISLAGTIVADPDIRQKNQQLVVEVTSPTKTRILVFAPLSQRYEYAEHVMVSGDLMPPEPFVTTAGHVFRYDHFLAERGIFSLLKQARVAEVSSSGAIWSNLANALFNCKHEFVKGLARALPNPYAELAVALLTGDRHQLASDVVTDLSLSGLIWVVVLAGYHVTLIVRGVLAVLFFLPRRIALTLAALCVAGLVFATGASAPSLRGSAMAGLAMFARGTNRTYDAVRALIVTVAALSLWNPLLLAYDLGFQLSILVTLAIIIGTPVLEMRLLWIKSSLLREVIVVSTLAQLACLPLLVWQTGQLETWAIPANILVMSFVPLVMVVSVVAGFAGILAPSSGALASVPLASIAGFPAHAVLRYLLTVAQFAASLPYANAALPTFSFGFVILAYALLFGLLLKLKMSSRRFTRLLPKSVSPLPPSSRSQGMPQHTISYPPACSQPYTRAPTYPPQE